VKYTVTIQREKETNCEELKESESKEETEKKCPFLLKMTLSQSGHIGNVHDTEGGQSSVREIHTTTTSSSSPSDMTTASTSTSVSTSTTSFIPVTPLLPSHQPHLHPHSSSYPQIHFDSRANIMRTMSTSRRMYAPHRRRPGIPKKSKKDAFLQFQRRRLLIAPCFTFILFFIFALHILGHAPHIIFIGWCFAGLTFTSYSI